MLAKIHESFIHTRRVRVLATLIAELLPPGARVLDVGCGDGRMALEIQRLRPDAQIEGLDVFVRPQTLVPVTAFDGVHLPYPDRSWDVVLFVDVIHHAAEQEDLLREAARVAGKHLILKDHLLQGWLAGPTLRFMDRQGNSRHGVALPYHYWTPQQWREVFSRLNMAPGVWKERLGLYPLPLSWFFGRNLHFLARLDHVSSPSA